MTRRQPRWQADRRSAGGCRTIGGLDAELPISVRRLPLHVPQNASDRSDDCAGTRRVDQDAGHFLEHFGQNGLGRIGDQFQLDGLVVHRRCETLGMMSSADPSPRRSAGVPRRLHVFTVISRHFALRVGAREEADEGVVLIGDEQQPLGLGSSRRTEPLTADEQRSRSTSPARWVAHQRSRSLRANEMSRISTPQFLPGELDEEALRLAV